MYHRNPDEQLRQLELAYRHSESMEDLAKVLNYRSRVGQVNWWQAVDVIKTHYYGDRLPTIRKWVVGDSSGTVEIGRSQGSLKTRPEGYYYIRLFPSASGEHADEGLFEAIPIAYNAWIETAQNIPITIISSDDTAIMDQPIKPKHLAKLIEWFVKYYDSELAIRPVA